MKKNKYKFNNFIITLPKLIANVLLLIMNKLGFEGNYTWIPTYSIDLDTTSYNLIPFTLDKLTYTDFKHIITDYLELGSNNTKYIYIFGNKGELITNAPLTFNLDDLLDIFWLWNITQCKNYILINQLEGDYKFYIHLSDKDILNDIKNKDI
jgi:hypothetical protein